MSVGVSGPVVAALFEVELPQGRCVGVSVPAAVDAELEAALLPEERDHLRSLGPARRPSFWGGRVALRLALKRIGCGEAPLLPDSVGAPVVPSGFVGSISHTRGLAVGLAAVDAAGVRVGVDVEGIRHLRVDVARRVMTSTERGRLAGLATGERDRCLIQHFSLKEAFYKAVNGFALARVSFQNVEVTQIAEDGRDGGRVLFAAPAPLQQRLAIDAWLGAPWPGYIVASVRAQLQPSR